MRDLLPIGAPLAGLALLLGAGCRAPALPEPTDSEVRIDFSIPPLLENTELGAGDLVSIVVRRQPELSSLEGLRVDPGGQLRLPLVGAVQLAGRTLDAAEAEIEARLATYVKSPDVTLNLLESSRNAFFVFGAVRQPARYPLTEPLSAYQALAVAGGVEPGGDREQICLLREADGFVDVHLFDARTPNESGYVPIHPGDLLFVRLTGTGRFREQVLPVLQGIAPAVSSLVNLGLVSDAIND